jgi:hypothetical protein
MSAAEWRKKVVAWLQNILGLAKPAAAAFYVHQAVIGWKILHDLTDSDIDIDSI